MSQISKFIAQSGPISWSLVARDTNGFTILFAAKMPRINPKTDSPQRAENAKEAQFQAAAIEPPNPKLGKKKSAPWWNRRVSGRDDDRWRSARSEKRSPPATTPENGRRGWRLEVRQCPLVRSLLISLFTFIITFSFIYLYKIKYT